MKIGIDFDGVVADNVGLKIDYIRENFGIILTSSECKREIAVARGVPNDEYTKMLELIYNDPEVSLKAKEIPGALEKIRMLQAEHNYIEITTSRYDQGRENIQRWLEIRNAADIPVTNTSNKSKKEFCRGCDIFVDDDLDKLEDLVGVVPHLFLFDMPYNQHVQVPEEKGSKIARAYGWSGFYEDVRRLSM